MKILIVVDVQVDFTTGTLAVPRGQKCALDIANFVNMNGANYDVIIGTQDWHPFEHIGFFEEHEGANPFEQITLTDGTKQMLWPRHCVAGTNGADFDPALSIAQRQFDFIIRKGNSADVDSYSAFFDNIGKTTQLGRLISETDSVTICGIATDVCVKATAIDALKFTRNVTVLKDLCAPVTDEGETVAIEEMKLKGIKIE
jgi:nicotinamidase/pyrazinamidase